jgi:hypothetical protein
MEQEYLSNAEMSALHDAVDRYEEERKRHRSFRLSMANAIYPAFGGDVLWSTLKALGIEEEPRKTSKSRKEKKDGHKKAAKKRP